MADHDEFVRLAQAHRRELLAHCYQMLGSVDEAEDLVQETYLRAWRSYDTYEARASLRTWLYRIATNACLTAMEHRTRRPLPAGLGAPGTSPDEPVGAPATDIPWLQPLPDVLVDPATVVSARGSLRLAVVAALQHLPPRQRAVLILREVLAWRAHEVADALGTSTAAVKSTLQRARARLDEVAPEEDLVAEPSSVDERALVDRYMAAFEYADADGLARLLCDDVELDMPPYLVWFRGRKHVFGFMESKVLDAYPVARIHMVPVGANGQPAVAAYERGPDGVRRAHSVQLITPQGDRIRRITAFLDPGLFERFGLPRVLD
ncbi:sigma-70 family RNA polymerase sigma factor [Streptomyces sp. YC504]|uniref:RNA polymerase sigma factor n=1 Tax=Streptomyces mesophilus TaxID=1775132 RepID=A0A6G4XG63_9ACTN|nr:sigma-70 family RNA polymerase sigma factor [Streptomyces mesophilus]NGO75631.1 sigma-70 family RNA polymerase sigma factor [Streptomyces mesophilus]